MISEAEKREDKNRKSGIGSHFISLKKVQKIKPYPPFREIIVSPYRFFYREKGKTVWIVAVWHGAQLPEEPNEA